MTSDHKWSQETHLGFGTFRCEHTNLALATCDRISQDGCYYQVCTGPLKTHRATLEQATSALEHCSCLKPLKRSIKQSGVTSLTFFCDDHAAIAAQRGKQFSESTLLWCFLLRGKILHLDGFQKDRAGSHLNSRVFVRLIVAFSIATSLKSQTAAETAGWLRAAATSAASTELLAGTVAVEASLLSSTRTLRVTSCPLPPNVPLPPLLRWHSDTAPKVPGTSTTATGKSSLMLTD